MAKPDDIPQDVWDVAAKVHGYPTTVGSQPSWVLHIATITARAILAERERCASFHDDMSAQHETFREDSKGGLIEHHAKMARCHRSYASAIREGR